MTFKKGEVSNHKGNPRIAEYSALYSTGPRTIEGKKISSKNATKWGYYSQEQNIKFFKCSTCTLNCKFKIDGYDKCRLIEYRKELSKNRDLFESCTLEDLNKLSTELAKINSKLKVGLYNYHETLQIMKLVLKKVESTI